MCSFIIAFLMGDLWLQTFLQLPSKILIIGMVMASFLLWFCLKKHCRYVYLPFAFTLGFAFTFWYANSVMSWTLPRDMEGKPMLVIGYVASLPVVDNWQTSFLFELQETKALIKLSWRDHNQHIKVGEKRQLLVRLKRIHGTQNPGAFDYEAWAIQKGLRATGYILSSKDNILLSHQWHYYPIDQVRQILQEKIQALSPNSNTAPWLMALIIGERNGIRQEDWEVLRKTGTNHLMAIAGLHIGIMAGFAHVIFSWLWRRVPSLVLLLPAQLAGACAALLIAVLYSALAGFSVPTQRACIMLTVFILTLLSRRKISAWNSWSLAMLFVLLLNPLSVLTESFWLSFGTIALIIYGMSGRLVSTGFWWKWGRVQWVIGFGLIPLTLALFQECSLVSFFANSIAIPWLGFFILPFCFLSGVFLFISPAFGGFLLAMADKSLAGLWILLTWFSQLHFSSWHQAVPSHGILLMTIVGFLILLLPAGVSGRGMGIFWLMPLILFQPIKPASGDIWMTLLDVGQGLSIVIQTKEHTLLYDAGPKYNANFDMGESVVLPYFRTVGAKQIDMLVISHGDNDHIGGAQAILKSLPVLEVLTSVPEKILSSAIRYCLAGYSWQWDDVHFAFVYPSQDNLNLGNDSSCVLSIDNGTHRILLTGDIEKYAENDLIKRSPEQLAATILVAPHHGSKTSGVKEFIAAVHPQFVLYATGYHNRYHFPHQTVVATYEEINAVQLNTVATGAIQFKLKKEKAISPPKLYRVINRRYWYS